MELNMIDKKIQDLIEKALLLKKKFSLKYFVFTLGNTRVNVKGSYYFTPFRKGENFILFGAVVFSEKEGSFFLEKLDSVADIIYVDCEKKSKNIESSNGNFNLERLSHEIIKDSKLRFFKGNDLTVSTIDSLVFNILKSQKKLVGGSKILVVGMGNVGFKISLKLVERGANIKILSKNINRTEKLVQSLNEIKPSETISEVKLVDIKNSVDLKKMNIIILCHLSSLEEYSEYYKNCDKSTVFIDVGKGCLTANQIEFLNANGNYCLRLDIGDFLIDYINMDIKQAFRNFEIPKSKKIDSIRYINRGLIGVKGDVVVDDINNPTFKYGICDGKGGFIKKDYS
jgi:hypothetical protein